MVGVALPHLRLEVRSEAECPDDVIGAERRVDPGPRSFS